ncbi:MAG TPA: HU family DNA-binding protein [Anaerolineae bacterium]|nr:HU family DNA-binding protein [Anaerolineae bacterium]
MTKTELIEQMADDAGISKTEAGKALNSLVNSIGEAVKEEDGKIRLPGFGTFSKAYRKARQGVNPATGKKMTIEARHVVKFKPGKTLKDVIKDVIA